ncbi:PREDICTED: protein SCAI isoform X1 [Rhagoletis zephyria]|uniref:protein SCAI isoform X1 n=1 Tax=Rhagoletis zephyria TaxID=28612 RepID=UPI0008119B86|nr:PREDICTED: protein SCAI isoform X1 [Rhagoletis zephyria]XP_036337667.1 protein SCAI isoform X1 [Rhagoletis pomonella]
MVKMESTEEQDRKLVLEFCHLLEKSKQLFNGLRDLPQYGHRQWQAYFGRTFDVYTKLWKFQQQHRMVLDSKYGLKRWQIGEIASKIGQLYYHYYLRTSETNYLNEAYQFYAAIRGRAYYSRAIKEDRPDLMVKKLRYYARFIVVCLLLKKMKLVRELVTELEKQIQEYTTTYEPEDHLEWSLVLEEIKGFIKAEAAVAVLHADSNPIILSHSGSGSRLSPLTTPPCERSPHMTLSLQEILIVGSACEQAKFSELTMDMFRMLQTLEREPTESTHPMSITHGMHGHDASPAASRIPPYGVPGSKGYLENGRHYRDNPHKYLLYKPSISQLLVFLASGFKELPPGGALLLYMSADGCFSTTKHPEDYGYELGGLATSVKRDGVEGGGIACRGKSYKENHCLYPGDLYPFTRRPMFIIIDSDNSFVFQHIPRYFGQPLVILMSPQDVPPAFQADVQHHGSLFTLFLHSPLTALCYICNVGDVPIHHWERCQSHVDRFITEASRLVTRCRIDEIEQGIGFIDSSYVQFFGDDFLRTLILRFVFCDVVLRLHRGFRGRHMRPRCEPPLPSNELLEHPSLSHIIFQLASGLDVRGHFSDGPECD